jgi:hypothetical protein
VWQLFRKTTHWAVLFSVAGCVSVNLPWWGSDADEGWDHTEAIVAAAAFLFVVMWQVAGVRDGPLLLLHATAILLAVGIFVWPHARLDMKARLIPAKDAWKVLTLPFQRAGPGVYLAVASGMGLVIVGALQLRACRRQPEPGISLQKRD